MMMERERAKETKGKQKKKTNNSNSNNNNKKKNTIIRNMHKIRRKIVAVLGIGTVVRVVVVVLVGR